MAADKTEISTDAGKLFTRYKRLYEAERELQPDVREHAAAELLRGVTPAQLAAATGLSSEFFRRIARDVGAERKRPPTVGKLADKQQPTES